MEGPTQNSVSLQDLLRTTFGFEGFRPFQEDVCRAAVAGESLLLVMPTGAGKSLCYQLPGLARGGTTLVVSPLIALMEDQATKLLALGVKAERIHSGRSRADSRRACEEYLAGELDFLFIAPERLGVAGFPEMLARRRPSLIAVDEAHCISQWGHDFRPDYRLLGERLPLLQPAPIVALTATATPQVQSDILRQLGIPEGRRFIHGFRRDNIAIERVTLRPSERPALTAQVLDAEERRPAIVYAPTRKEATRLAGQLGASFPTGVYHAGLDPEARDDVQTRFLSGDLDVIVATIAFGMGIDKSDVRTVVHTAMPGTVENYYQEIGRAGRDGLPSRALLLCGFIDRRTHEYFLDRDYPETAQLDRLAAKLSVEPQDVEALADRIDEEPEVCARRLDKLRVHGGARVDAEGGWTRGAEGWRRPYEAQRRHKLEQLALTTRFLESKDCRMLHLVRHFGDQHDSGENCGRCDVCDPASAISMVHRNPETEEQNGMMQLLDALRRHDGQSAGRLHRELFGKAVDRKEYEGWVAALVRAGLLLEREDSFEKDGRVIEFKRLHLGPEGLRGEPDWERVFLLEPIQPDEAFLAAAPPARRSGGGGRGGRRGAGAALDLDSAGGADVPADQLERLREWRSAEAKKRKVPAYCILHDKTMRILIAHKPKDKSRLLAVKGIGPTFVDRYADEILALIADLS